MKKEFEPWHLGYDSNMLSNWTISFIIHSIINFSIIKIEIIITSARF